MNQNRRDYYLEPCDLPALVELNRPAIATLLVKQGADPNAKSFFQMPLLHYAATQFRTNHMDLLMDLGANPNLLDDMGYAPMHYVLESADDTDERVLNIMDRWTFYLREGPISTSRPEMGHLFHCMPRLLINRYNS